MTVSKKYEDDIQFILSRQHDNGGEYWASADGRLGVGSPFCTLTSVLMLSDLGVNASHPVFKGACDLILSSWREDGRFRLAPKAAIYPCHTAGTARILCRAGYTQDWRLKRTFEHLLEIQYKDGGWRCNTFKFGRGPETEYSNPGPTLEALDAFRFTDYYNREKALDKAVEFLLDHWVIKKPLGPCHFGIGTRFMKIEFPFFRYNLFLYVYVLSFYERAKRDPRFQEALKALESKTINGKVKVEHCNTKLANLSYCKKNEFSEIATKYYQEILRNLNRK